jgi:hypothetical protein
MGAWKRGKEDPCQHAAHSEEHSHAQWTRQRPTFFHRMFE